MAMCSCQYETLVMGGVLGLPGFGGDGVRLVNTH